MISFHCEACGVGFEVTDDYAGKSGSCPKCKAKIHVPRLEGQHAADDESIAVLLTNNYFGARRDAAYSLHGPGLPGAIGKISPYLESQYAWQRDAAQAALQCLRGTLSDEDAANTVLEGNEASMQIDYFCTCPGAECTFPTTFCKKITSVPISPFSEFRCPSCAPDGVLGYNVASTPWNGRMQELAQSKLDADSEKSARQLVSLQAEQTREGINAVGQRLSEAGGFFRMLAVCHRVGVLTGSYRQIEYAWDGICGWQA